MKGLVWYGPNDVRYEDWPVPELGDDEILLKVAYCGICGSEMSIIHGTNTHGAKPPKILGHEFSGVIAEVGKGVKDFHQGERVTAHPHAGCGKCYFCKRAQEGFCLDPFNFITSVDSGAFSEYTKVKEKTVYRIPEEMSLKTASLIEPFSIAVHASTLVRFYPGNTVVVQGGGTIGLCCLLIFKHYGAGAIILSEPVALRREVAKRFGADVVIDPLKDSLYDCVMDVTDGFGVDLCIESSGSDKACEQVINLTKKGGTVLVVGVVPPDKKTPISFCDINKHEISIVGSNWSPYSFDRTISIMRRMMKEINLDSIITHEFPLSEFKEAFRTQETKEAIKTTFVINKIEEE